MCGFNNSPVLWFTVRAIAEGAAGKPLAVWALAEMEAEQKRELEQQAAMAKMWEAPE